MITFVSCPRPSDDPTTRRAQLNAIGSWSQAAEQTEVILFGTPTDERVEARWEEVPTNDWGTPRFDHIIMSAQRLAANDLICYVNSDIILMPNLEGAIDKVLEWNPAAVVVGARTDLDVDYEIDFSDNDWDRRLKEKAAEGGKLMIEGIDYIVFPRGTFPDIPPFAVGRTAFDNWMLWRARRNKMPVVDVTAGVVAVHQNHATKWSELTKSPEADANRRLAGRWPSSYTLRDATHRLDAAGAIQRRNSAALKNRLREAGRFLMAGAKRAVAPAYHRVRHVSDGKESR